MTRATRIKAPHCPYCGARWYGLSNKKIAKLLIEVFRLRGLVGTRIDVPLPVECCDKHVEDRPVTVSYSVRRNRVGELLA